MLKIEYMAMALCFSGVIAIAMSKNDQHGIQGGNQLIGIIASTFNSWCYSAVCVVNRKLSDVYFVIVTFWHSLIGLIISVFVVGGQWLIQN